MTPMSDQDRSELDWVKSSKLVRLGVYEAGILIGRYGGSPDRPSIWRRLALARLSPQQTLPSGWAVSVGFNDLQI